MSEEFETVNKLASSRRSIRGYLPASLDRELLTKLFEAAQRAPSWCNIQPWRVHVTEGEATRELAKRLVEAATSRLPNPDIPFPMNYPEPHATHRRSCGRALYGAMGVARDDQHGRKQAWLRNYELFDAPHLAVVTRDKSLGEYASLDVGVWLGYLLIAAESLGVDCCAMASVAAYPDLLRASLSIDASEVVLFGVALGKRDSSVAANDCQTERANVCDNVSFVPQLAPT